jgi:short-subunit dehydrogenase
VSAFRERYGPWAIIAGASAGLGEAFAEALAARSLNLVLIARRPEALATLQQKLVTAHHVEVITLAGDLGDATLPQAIADAVGSREVGLLVYNAAHSVRGPFLDHSLEEHLQVLDVNCRAPLALAHRYGRPMVARGRGGILLMASVAGSQGNPLLASYAASKAFNLVLAEGLWDELKKRGVDVLACRAGATRTRGYELSQPKGTVPLMEPQPVVEAALEALGHGPSVTPGWLNRLASFLFGRLLPRRTSIHIMGSATARLYE